MDDVSSDSAVSSMSCTSPTQVSHISGKHVMHYDLLGQCSFASGVHVDHHKDDFQLNNEMCQAVNN